MIEINKLNKRFGSFFAVRDLSLQVHRGEVFGFLGPNGAGKTTTMKILVGLMKPTSGSVKIAGMEVVEHPLPTKRIIGYIPDRPFLYEKLSGVEFLRFMSGLFGLPRKEVKTRIEQLLELFELTEWSHELIESYSHGMKQRLTMVAALLHRPELLVVDEPMVGLDPRGAVLVKNIFKKLCQQGNNTVFLSTHTLEVAEELCDRVAILNRGQVVAMGSMPEIRRQAGEGATGNLQQLFLKLTGGEDVTTTLGAYQL